MAENGKDASLLSKPDDFRPNFSAKYTIVLDHPLSTVFPVLAHGDTLERNVRLSELCSDFELLQRDTVSTPNSAPLTKSRVRTLPSSPEGLPRQYFRLQETVPILGLFDHAVEIAGTFTWDEEAKVALYESSANQSVLVWKLREFEETEESGTKKTRVTETIEGHCPSLLKFIVQRETRKSHVAHMDKYHTLF